MFTRVGILVAKCAWKPGDGIWLVEELGSWRIRVTLWKVCNCM